MTEPLLVHDHQAAREGVKDGHALVAESREVSIAVGLLHGAPQLRALGSCHQVYADRVVSLLVVEKWWLVKRGVRRHAEYNNHKDAPTTVT